eukprot:85079-Prorocentrum_lima.AAC.1
MVLGRSAYLQIQAKGADGCLPAFEEKKDEERENSEPQLEVALALKVAEVKKLGEIIEVGS